ncbi:osm1 [Symbiodinium necroappetens]|uniref:Osm1 protein n=1 Tax=Symbiodinium necroappetens TaxID=1628268 RepID=A0A812MF11_9DINO|nr:osm1 [Symbiodinium necroappetens]
MACVFPANQVIVVGGGLAGMSAANTVIELGGRSLLLDKSSFCGGNSTKATSGINGAGTKTQKGKSIPDNAEIFIADTLKGGAKKPELAKVLCANSAADVDWLVDKFDLDLSLVARLGGHSQPRTHRGKERFPGMTITYALIQMLEKVAEKTNRARIITKAEVFKLLQNGSAVVGCEYKKAGKVVKEFGPMVLASGGFGADFGADSLLATYRPDLLHLPTTNGEHCTGDAIKMGEAIGAATIDLEWVQVHPTGLVKPDDPDAKVKFLAAEALRGVGGIVLDANGDRFCNELGRRDYVTGEMWKNKPPFRLCLNRAAADEIIWHAKHYTGRGVMKFYSTGEDLAKDMGVPLQKLVDAHQKHFEAAKKQEKDPDGGPFPAYPSGKTWDEPSGKTGSGKKFFHNIIDGSKVPTEPFYVAIITPVIHYCMGGLECTVDAECIDKKSGKVIPGLYVAGEAAGGIHGNNRLGGNSLLDCVVFGRVAGKAACKFTFGAGEKFKPCPPPGELKACSLHSRWPAGGGPEFVVVGKCILFNKTGDATAPVGGLAPGKVAVLRAEAEVRVGVGKVKDDDFKVLDGFFVGNAAWAYKAELMRHIARATWWRWNFMDERLRCNPWESWEDVTAAANETSKIFNWIEHEVTLKAPWLCKRRHSLCYWAKTISRIGYPKSVEFTVIGSFRPHEELSVLASWVPEGLVTKGSLAIPEVRERKSLERILDPQLCLRPA